MFFSRSSSKLASLFLLSGLLSNAISPSVAADSPEPSAIQQTQLLAERYGLPETTESDRAGEIDASAPLTQADFLSSAQPFFDHANVVFHRDFSTFESFERLHFMAVRYLADQFTDLQAEVDSLIAQVQQVQHTSQSTQSRRPIRPLLRSQQKSTASQLNYPVLKDEDTQPPTQPSEAIDAAEIENALEQLQVVGIDFSSVDGTFQPEQLLTRGEYLQALHQVDQFLIENQYNGSISIESIVDADLSRMLTEFESINETMKQIVSDIAEVRSLTNRLQLAIDQKSARSSQTKAELSNQVSKPNDKDSNTVENTPAPLTSIKSADKALVTQGDFALYITSQITQVLSSRISSIKRDDLSYHVVVYAELSAELAAMVSVLSFSPRLSVHV